MIDYKEFCDEIFGKKQKQIAAQKDSRASGLIDTLKRKLNERGPKGILGLIKTLKEIDTTKSGKLNLNELKTAIKNSIKLGIDSSDVEVIFKELDTDKDSLITQSDLLKLLKTPMNDKRRKVAAFVYSLIKTEKGDYVRITDMKKKYNGGKHPAVLAGRKTEAQVAEELTTALDLFKDCHGIKDDTLTKLQFLEFYNNISTSIDSDQYFEEMMSSCWGITPEQLKEIDEAPPEPLLGPFTEELKTITPKKKVEPIEVPSSEETKITSSMQKFRESVISRGVRSILGIERQFKVYSKDDCLELNDLKKTAEDFRLHIETKEIETMFKELDKSEKGKIECEKLLHILLGGMNRRRKLFVETAFHSIDKDNDGVIDRDDIARIFEGWKHPDAKSGKKRPDDLLHEVLEILDSATALHRGSKTDGRYTKEEFINYFEYISACAKTDEDFENIFTTLWRVDKTKLPSTEEKVEEVVKKVETVEDDTEQDE